MTNVFEYLSERFLRQYYLYEAIFKDFISEGTRRKAFDLLAEIFCIEKKEKLDKYYELSQSEPFRNISDLVSCNKMSRIIEYSEVADTGLSITQKDRIIMAQKSEAMRIKDTIFSHYHQLTAEMVAEILNNSARAGNLNAEAVLAFIEMHGICVCRDTASAIKRIRRCAKWNQLFGILMGIAYDKTQRDKHFAKLYSLSVSANEEDVYGYISNTYAYSSVPRADENAALLERLFGMCIANRDSYDRMLSSVVFSPLVSAGDKERLLTGKQKNLSELISIIPFDVAADRIVFDSRCADSVPLKRNEELKKIRQSIAIVEKCTAKVRKPLMIASEDGYVLEMYCRMLKDGFGKKRIYEIDCSTLTEKDLQPTYENILIRAMNKTKTASTVFIFKNCEMLGGKELEAVRNLLDVKNRRHFQLLSPQISVDLSESMLVLFSDKRSQIISALAAKCDTVMVEGIRKSEMDSAIDSMLAIQSRLFGCDYMTVSGEGKERLKKYGAEQIELILDGAIRSAICEDKKEITVDALIAAEKLTCFVGHEAFGYTGGNEYA